MGHQVLRGPRPSAVGLVAMTVSLLLAPAGAGASAVASSPRSAAASDSSNCPWADPSLVSESTPSALAKEVVARMSLSEELDLVDLSAKHGYENSTTAIPALCIPALTMQDGPDGLAFGDRGVTQLPSSLGVAASFDSALAYSYGQLIGDEARRQGIDVLQGPNLNIDRVSQSGREFEGYGEDPFLVSTMGVSDIEGIQSEGVMADAKHFTAYNQETDRVALDEQVSARALEEIYLPPFKAAVDTANVASVMCSYGLLNGTPDCADAALFRLLYGKWGFQGFVRSDLASIGNAPAAFAAGLDAIKPAASGALSLSILRGDLSNARLDDAVTRILTEMFAFHMIDHRIVGHADTPVQTRSHQALALAAAEESMVLLKNHDGVLPLDRFKAPSIAVIGLDGAGSAMSAGEGSAYVVPPFVSSPYDAIRALVGHRASITFEPGGTSLAPAAPLVGWPIIPSTGLGAVLLAGRPFGSHEPGTVRATGIIGTGSFGHTYGAALDRSSVGVVPPVTGDYVFSMSDSGDAWLSVDGQPVISSPGVQGHSTWSVGLHLVAGHRYGVSLAWYPVGHAGEPAVGWRFVQPEIDAAVDAAKHAKVAIVFASAPSGENHDRPTLSLPGDQNELISAVAAVNHHTIVVLNTGGAILMPWLSKVSGVLEAWYPGEQDGTATAAVLFGKVDPSGHLPITFPSSSEQSAVHGSTSFPGNAGVATYAEGLDVGYRYDEAHSLAPLFPFGYGLSYTTFSIGGLNVVPTSAGYDAQVTVTNTGSREGREVVQAYLQFPEAADEPPRQLKAFASVDLRPGASTTVDLTLPASSFESFQGTSWQVVPGGYGIYVGDSSTDLPLDELVPPPLVTMTAGGYQAATASS